MAKRRERPEIILFVLGDEQIWPQVDIRERGFDLCSSENRCDESPLRLSELDGASRLMKVGTIPSR